MANDWTRLLQEASRHGGPDAMRSFYSNRGKAQGAAAALLLAGGVALVVKARENFIRARALRDFSEEQEPPATAPDSAPNGVPPEEDNDPPGEPPSGSQPL